MKPARIAEQFDRLIIFELGLRFSQNFLAGNGCFKVKSPCKNR